VVEAEGQNHRVGFSSLVYTISKNALIPLSNLLLHNYLGNECIQPAMWATLCLLGKL
jgi:hypothetical protein